MERYDEAWVRAQVAQTIEVWRSSADATDVQAPRYTANEQAKREAAYDDALQAAEREVRAACRTRPEQIGVQQRLVASFGQFAAKALDLNRDAIELLTREFLPVGTELARRARRFDSGLAMAEIVQAARNAWTACGLQPLVNATVRLTPAIFGYSLMYPYSDNYLDDDCISTESKQNFSQRFRRRLLGEELPATNKRECAIWKLVALVEAQYPPSLFPQVFDCLLAIHQAQEQSIRQVRTAHASNEDDVLTLSCAKGGTSVLTDACLARGSLSRLESRFAFEWGVLLQLGDDLQDVREDMRRGSATVFSRAAAARRPLDAAALQLLSFSEKVGRRMDELPFGDVTLKELLKMSWRSLIVRAIADSHEFFSPEFIREAERSSPFRFDFLRKRSDQLASREGLYASLFGKFVEFDAEEEGPEWDYESAGDVSPAVAGAMY